MRGPFAQCIDANQGAYFEQMMLLPCALGEFRSRKRGDGLSKRIVGFPEHITSDIGSIGDFAASAEVAFGTILQRTYSVLGARMHYGHPDIMNKLYMMQQGGVSKATKTVNLSEDIFAGMDFTLRGEDRKIQHSEYFHLAKGRDLGFNTVLGFFSKLASGTGEQVLTRQTFRLGQVLHLPDALAFYYAHAGYYFTQFFVSLSMPLVLLTDSGTGLDAYLQFDPFKVWFSWLMVLFLVATSLPLFMELWMERHFKMVIGHYVVNEIRFGGATYVATGRGLPTAAAGELKLKKVGGLYLDYAAIAYYDGATLLTGTVLICVAGGVSGAGQAAGQLWWIFISLGLCIVSWLYAPFIFNPYQFELLHFREDLRCVTAFFLEDSGRHWVEWYDRTQLKVGNALHRSMINISFFVSVFFLAAWYATVNTKIEALSTAYSGAVSAKPLHFQLLVPPVACSLVYCVLAVIFESLMGWSSIVRRRLRRPRRSKAKTFRFGSMATMGRFGSMATAGQLPAASSDEEAQAAPAPNVAEGAAAEAHAGAHETPSWWPFGSAVDVAPPQISEVDSEEDEDDAVEQDAPHAVAEDHTVLPVPAFAGLKSMKPPNAGLAGGRNQFLVVAVDLSEAAYCLYIFYKLGWRTAYLSGFILKWATLMMRRDAQISLLRRPGQLWVRAHRMARDIACSSLIFWVMAPFVLLNSLNEYLCPGCSAHMLLVYRDPGHLARKEAVVVDILGGDLEDGRGFYGLNCPGTETCVHVRLTRCLTDALRTTIIFVKAASQNQRLMVTKADRHNKLLLTTGIFVKADGPKQLHLHVKVMWRWSAGAGDEGDEEEEVPQSQSVSSKQAHVSTVSWAKQGSLYSPSVGTVVQASGRGLRGTAFSVPELEAYDPAMYRTAASVAARAPQSTALPLADTPGSWTAGSRPPVGSKEAAARVASKSGTAGAFPLSGRQPHVQSSFDRSDFNTSWPQPSGARYPYS
ncbi:unnamed protein product [Polarella glacialis]|uniref:Glycosyl transferase 48 domain-containing protein n=1 Tax=Polarella glacialis TaxID=89957 RepID=A0A813KBK2_POLGL|nr:unnamed protein product [Polarella glacialis]